MGMMKEYLCNKITEFAALHHLTEDEVYQNDRLYQQAVEYADKCLKKEINEGNDGKNQSV
ncbi:MAG: hypothetical protein WC196_06205 [Bacilli bacterium]|jgi:hypothetical protein